ncbi:MAG: response regulator [Candidatus Electrothrix sp. AR4]|nr:response regulator [Candidatus Electrothrix sp. AR4]
MDREQLIHDLRESETRWQFAVDGSGLGLWDWNIETNEVFFSKQWKTLLGGAKNKISNTLNEWRARIHPDDRILCRRAIDAHLKGKTIVYNSEHRLRSNNDTYKWVQGRGKVISRTDDGKPLRMIGTHTDITEQKKAEEDLKRQHQTEKFFANLLHLSLQDVSLTEIFNFFISELAQLPWLAVRKQGAIFLIGDEPDVLEMKAQIGLDKTLLSQCAFVPFGTCLCGRAAVSKKTIFADCINNNHDYLYTGIPPHGHYCIPMFSSSAQEKILGVFTLYTDAGSTYNKNVEKILLASSRLLATIILWKQAQENLARAKIVAESAAMVKNEFLANMSHDIRTPMNAIIGMNELTLNTKLTAEQRKYLTITQSAANSLLSLINDILDFSKIEAGQLILEERNFDLCLTLESILNMLVVRANEKKLHLHLEIAPDVNSSLLGDELRLRQILVNLINNAIKFTEQGGIVVSCEMLSESIQDIILQFQVTDSGIGIADEVQKSIFEDFQQADNSVTRTHGGTGLGLAICKRLTGLLNGEIRVESEIDKGSAFIFTACFKKTKIHEESNPALLIQHKSTPCIKTSLKVLLVEDNPFNQELAKVILEKEKHTVEIAATGVMALKALLTSDFDVVLMDVQMPEMDGLTTTKLIRLCETVENPPMRDRNYQELIQKLSKKIYMQHLPIIAMTANAMTGDREKCLESGMDDYVTKPFHLDAVVRVIERVVTTYQGRSAA